MSDEQPTDTQTADYGPVPYDRFKQVIGERNRFRSELDSLHAEHRDLGEQLRAARQELEQERAAARQAQQSANRFKISAECGLPLPLADRLQGDSEDELRADAQRLSHFIRPATPGVPPAGAPGRPNTLDLENMTPAQIRDQRAEVWKQLRSS